MDLDQPINCWCLSWWRSTAQSWISWILFLYVLCVSLKTFGQSFFSLCGVLSLWNSLPIELKNSFSLCVFNFVLKHISFTNTTPGLIMFIICALGNYIMDENTALQLLDLLQNDVYADERINLEAFLMRPACWNLFHAQFIPQRDGYSIGYDTSSINHNHTYFSTFSLVVAVDVFLICDYLQKTLPLLNFTVYLLSVAKEWASSPKVDTILNGCLLKCQPFQLVILEDGAVANFV